MTYMIKGLPRDRFAALLGRSDAELAAHGARRVVADSAFGFPCRVSLKDAASHAILVREQAEDIVPLVDEIPPVFARRTLSLRGFAANGDLIASRVARPEQHDRFIRELLADPQVDHIDAHNAGHGCFSARIERYMEAA